MRIEFVVPDYYGKYPKPCMGGWGRKLMLINPAGDAIPCHAAGVIPGMRFESVTARPLRWIWEKSEAFQRFRGEGWMPEPCRSCERRSQDFGGCRCQALLLAGDAAATDPACSLAASHDVVAAAVAQANTAPVRAGDATAGPVMQPSWVYRPNPQ
jgi:pyrroloquinoline quinone biosynthesis protein E